MELSKKKWGQATEWTVLRRYGGLGPTSAAQLCQQSGEGMAGSGRQATVGAGTYLSLGALQAAADHCMARPVQHPTQLLAQFQRSSTH